MLFPHDVCPLATGSGSLYPHVFSTWCLSTCYGFGVIIPREASSIHHRFRAIGSGALWCSGNLTKTMSGKCPTVQCWVLTSFKSLNCRFLFGVPMSGDHVCSMWFASVGVYCNGSGQFTILGLDSDADIYLSIYLSIYIYMYMHVFYIYIYI